MLPTKRFGASHPLALSAHNLLDYVTCTTISSIDRTDISCYLLDFVCRIIGTSRATALLHDFEVGYVISHVDNLITLQAFFVYPRVEYLDFDTSP